MVERGLGPVESELRGMVESLGMDWDRLERDALRCCLDGGGVGKGVKRRATVSGGGSDGVSGGGMPIVGGGGMIDG